MGIEKEGFVERLNWKSCKVAVFEKGEVWVKAEGKVKEPQCRIED